MDNILLYKIIIFGTIAGLAIVIGNRRRPDEIINSEKPVIKTFVTRKSIDEINCIATRVASQFGYTLCSSDQIYLIFQRKTTFIRHGHVFRISSESLNDWSNKVILELYSREDLGFGRKFTEKKNLNKLVESIRNEVRADQ